MKYCFVHGYGAGPGRGLVRLPSGSGWRCSVPGCSGAALYSAPVVIPAQAPPVPLPPRGLDYAARGVAAQRKTHYQAPATWGKGKRAPWEAETPRRMAGDVSATLAGLSQVSAAYFPCEGPR